ncbi:MAG TPA: MBL fold metallo-hydrolase [Thermoleophilaceae bacterium]|nr:MBL fold metallo-hydrolase [Thermoleophilaceae bacterium]
MSEIPGAGRRKVTKKLLSPTIEPVADGAWLLRGGGPPKRTMNVYLLQDGDGFTAYDGGIHGMAEPIREAARQLGGELKQMVLGHAHEDHRGAAPDIGVPVLCHEAERRDAERELSPDDDRGFDFSKLESRVIKVVMPRLLKVWDGGPVKIADTLTEGDEVAGFRVVHTPGHAPGLISLWRESDRLALVSDTLYTLDPDSVRTPYGGPRIPHPAFTPDRDAARDSLLKIAALEPNAVWAGHADPVTGDCRAQLEHAAATTY